MHPHSLKTPLRHRLGDFGLISSLTGSIVRTQLYQGAATPFKQRRHECTTKVGPGDLPLGSGGVCYPGSVTDPHPFPSPSGLALEGLPRVITGFTGWGLVVASLIYSRVKDPLFLFGLATGIAAILLSYMPAFVRA